MPTVAVVGAVTGQHVAFDAAIAALEPSRPDFEQAVSLLLREPVDHVERENLGISPASVVTLGARGWELIERARERTIRRHWRGTVHGLSLTTLAKEQLEAARGSSSDRAPVTV